jgi:non-ribosomal peptide synthetase component F
MLVRERLAPFLMNIEGSSMKLGELALESISLEKRVAQFDLSLSIAETGDEMLGSLEYSTDLFDPSTIQRMAEHFEMLLGNIVRDPTLPVSRLQLLTGTERQLFTQWANTSVDYRRSEILSELFEQQVARTPEAIALAFEDRELTYDELNGRANKLAHRLRGQGVGPDVLVGVLMERSIEMVVGLLGILKAGGAYVPLDPHYPQERLSYMLGDAQLETVLTQRRFADRPALSRVQAIALDTDWHMLSGESEQNLEISAIADGLAYVIYTSGSTGQPKGAMNTNGAISNRLCWMQAAYGLDESDRVLQKTPFTFDVSVWEFFWPLITGARLVMAQPGGHQDSTYLINLIVEQRITTLHFVPSMLQAFLENPRASDC